MKGSGQQTNKTARCFVVGQGKQSELNSCRKYQIQFSINKIQQTKIRFFSP